MNISTEQAEGVTIIAFEGSLDTNTAADAQVRLNGLVRGGATKLLIDFAALEYISSAGIGVVVATAKKLSPAGGSLRLCGLNETVSQIFEITGLNKVFRIFEDRRQALTGF